MNHQAKCETMRESFKHHNIEALKDITTKARIAYEETQQKYQEALNAYHKEYREIWKD